MNEADQFEAIVTEHYKALYRFALSLTRSEADALDLTQHTFCVWATKGHQLRDLAKVKAWLYTTLHRAFLSGRRRQNRFPQQDLDEAIEEISADTPVPSNQVDAMHVLPALAKVDEIYQAAVALFYLEDYAYKDIAVILDVPVGTVKSRISRGLEQLREVLLPKASQTRSADPVHIFPATSGREPVNATESGSSSPCHKSPMKFAAIEYDCWEWDLSSTLLQEPIVAG